MVSRMKWCVFSPVFFCVFFSIAVCAGMLWAPVSAQPVQPLPVPGPSSHPNTAVQEHIHKGEEFLGQGRWDMAIQELKKALRLDPNIAAVRANLGMAYYFQGEISAAIKELEEALTIEPGRVDAAHGLGLALYEKGELGGAVEAFRAATRLNAQAYYNLGNALEQQGNIDAAREAYTHYLATNPQTAEAPALRQAIAQGVVPTPAAGTAQDHFQRGQALLTKKDATGAVAEFLVAMRLKPNYAEACNLLGEAFRLKGDLDEAMAGYMMALRLDPKFGAVHRNMGQAFEETGNLQAAAQAYDRYLILVPGADDANEIRDKIADLRRSAQ